MVRTKPTLAPSFAQACDLTKWHRVPRQRPRDLGERLWEMACVAPSYRRCLHRRMPSTAAPPACHGHLRPAVLLHGYLIHFTAPLLESLFIGR